MIKIPLIGFDRQVFSMLVIYIGYLSLGAIIFVAVETDDEEHSRNASLSSSQLIKSMVEVLRKENLTDREIFVTFTNKMRESNMTQTVTWKKIFGEKFIFSMVLITTIGYGNVRPRSSWGKYACMIYAFFGIPLNLTFMRLLSLQFRAALRKVVKNGQKLMNSVYFDSLSISVYFIFFTSLLVFIPSFVFSYFETWDYVESVYYSFVTLSTIGFGDYVASVGSRHHASKYYDLHVMLMFIWLLLGVTFIAMCLNLLSYLLGLLILDKLDCKCHKRSAAKKSMEAIYGCLSELNWQLAKRKPQKFTKWKTIENFMDVCVENPQDITKETFFHVLGALDELNSAIYEDAVMKNTPKKLPSKVDSTTNVNKDIPKRFPTKVDSRTNVDEDVSKQLSKVDSKTDVNEDTHKSLSKSEPSNQLQSDHQNVYKSAEDWRPPTIGSVPNKRPGESEREESSKNTDSLKTENSEKQSSLKSHDESASPDQSPELSTKKGK